MQKVTTTRIIPGINAEHRIVSMPPQAWFWLDDFVKNCSPNGYKGLYSAFGIAISSTNLSDALHGLAQMHQEFCLREVYNLANDDEPDEAYIQDRIVQKINPAKTKPFNMPRIYKLFGFMPCPTTLESVWQRKHYHENLGLSEFDV